MGLGRRGLGDWVRVVCVGKGTEGVGGKGLGRRGL